MKDKKEETNEQVAPAPEGVPATPEETPAPPADAPAAPIAVDAPLTGDALLAKALEQGFTVKDLTPKDIMKIKNLEAVNRRFEQGSAQVMSGLLALLTEQSNINNLKNQLAVVLKEKYEIPDGAQWQADPENGRIFFKVQDAPPPVQ